MASSKSTAAGLSVWSNPKEKEDEGVDAKVDVNAAPLQQSAEAWPDLQKASKTETRGASRLRHNPSVTRATAGSNQAEKGWRSLSQPGGTHRHRGCMPRRDPLVMVYVCKECSERFVTETALIEHQESEGHWGPTVGDGCRRSFVRKCEVESVLASSSTKGAEDARPTLGSYDWFEDDGKGDNAEGSSAQCFALASPRSEESGPEQEECQDD